MSEPTVITATQFRRKYGYYARQASKGKVFVITTHGEKTHVFMSIATYSELRND